jgi:hypothetical protein
MLKLFYALANVYYTLCCPEGGALWAAQGLRALRIPARGSIPWTGVPGLVPGQRPRLRRGRPDLFAEALRNAQRFGKGKF